MFTLLKPCFCSTESLVLTKMDLARRASTRLPRLDNPLTTHGHLIGPHRSDVLFHKNVPSNTVTVSSSYTSSIPANVPLVGHINVQLDKLCIGQHATNLQNNDDARILKSTNSIPVNKQIAGSCKLHQNVKCSQKISSLPPTPSVSLRWEFTLDDQEKEKERIAVYKVNRRKRYLAAAKSKGLHWVQNYKLPGVLSASSEDSGCEAGASSASGALPELRVCCHQHVQ